MEKSIEQAQIVSTQAYKVEKDENYFSAPRSGFDTPLSM